MISSSGICGQSVINGTCFIQFIARGCYDPLLVDNTDHVLCSLKSPRTVYSRIYWSRLIVNILRQILKLVYSTKKRNQLLSIPKGAQGKYRLGARILCRYHYPVSQAVRHLVS